MPPQLPRPLRPLQSLLAFFHWQLLVALAVLWFASYPPRQTRRMLRAVAPYACLAATWTLYYTNMAALLVYVYTSLAAQGAAVRAASCVEQLSASNSTSDEASVLAAQKALEALEAVTKLAARSAGLTLASNVDVAIAVSDKKTAAWKTWAAQGVLFYGGWKVAQAWVQTEVTWGPLAKIPEMGRVTSIVFAWVCVWLAGTRLSMEVVWHVGRDVRLPVDWEPEPGEDPEGEKLVVSAVAEGSEAKPELDQNPETSKKPEGEEHKPTQVLEVEEAPTVEEALLVEGAAGRESQLSSTEL